MANNIGIETALLSSSKIVVYGCTLVGSIFMARILSQDDFGTYLQVMLLINTSTMLFTLGIPNSIFYYFPKKINRRHFLWRTFFLLLAIGIFVGITLIIFSKTISNYMNNEKLMHYMPNIAFCIVTYLVYQMTSRILIADSRAVVLAVVEISTRCLMLSIIIGVLFAKPLLGLLIDYVTVFHVSYFLIIVCILFVISSKYDTKNECITMKEQLKYSLPLSASVFLAVISKEFDKYIISAYLTPESLAIYSRGAIDLPFVYIFTYTVSELLFPKFVKAFDRNDLKAIMDLWHKSIIKVGIVMLPMFSYLWIVADDFILGMYSDKYEKSVEVFMIYLFLIPMQITTYGTTIMAAGRNNYILICTLFGIFSNILLSIYLIQKIGFVGPAAATIVSMYFSTGVYLYYNTKILKTGFKTIFPWVKTLKIFVISCAVGFPLSYLKNILNLEAFINSRTIFHIANMIIISAVYFPLYFSICVKIKLFENEDLELLFKFIPNKFIPNFIKAEMGLINK